MTYMRGVLIAVLMLAETGVVAVLGANMTATSLNGISHSYADLALYFLGEPAGRTAFTDTRPFCVPPGVPAEPGFGGIETACAAPPPGDLRSADCRPVRSSEHIPTYVAPYLDAISVTLLVAGNRVSEVASFIANANRAEVDRIGIVGGAGRDLLGHRKRVQFAQCPGYGYIVIQQSYFEQP